jgi:hypothetical protein
MDETEYVCPACGETIVIPVDASQGRNQQYVEDCPVCCRPVVIRIQISKSGSVRCDAEAE